MAIDPSIALGVKPVQLESPVNSLAQLLQVQGAQQQNQLGQAKLDAYQQATGRQNLVYQTMQQLGAGATDDDRVNALKSLGEFDLADKVQTGQLARTKTDADAKKALADAAKNNGDVLNQKLQHHRDQLGPVNDPQGAAAWVTAMYQDKDMAPIVQASGRSLDQQIAAIPTDPKQFAQWKLQSSLGADKLVEYTRPNANTVATNETSRANNAATVAATRRGQDLTDARARDALDAGRNQVVQSDNGPVLVNTRTGAGKTIMGPDGQPLPGVTKPLNDSQSKALLFGTRMQEADKILGQLATEGTTTSFPGSRAPIIGGAISALSSDNRQMLDQAKRDFINATLRRESGAAISAGEFENGEKQYFPQIGEGAKVIAQKARNRQLAMRGVLAEVPEKQRGSITPATTSTGAPTTNAKGWTLHVDASGNRAYVAPNGKDYEEVH